jgi:hypothetical protein
LKGRYSLEKWRTWEDNIKMYLMEIGGRVWIGYIWLRKVITGGIL